MYSTGISSGFTLILLVIGYVNGRSAACFFNVDVRLPLLPDSRKSLGSRHRLHHTDFPERTVFPPKLSNRIMLPELVYTVVILIIVYPLFNRLNNVCINGNRGVRANLFDRLKNRALKIVSSRVFVLTIILLILFGVLIRKVFVLQIIHGQEYVEEYALRSRRPERSAGPAGIFMTLPAICWLTTRYLTRLRSRIPEAITTAKRRTRCSTRSSSSASI